MNRQRQGKIISHFYIYIFNYKYLLLINKGGNGGKKWMDKYVDTYIPLAGPLLGVPKVVAMWLSGESFEMAQMPKPLQKLKDFIIARSWFNRWIRNVYGSYYLMPVGGERIWGNIHNGAPEDINDKSSKSFGSIINFMEPNRLSYTNCEGPDQSEVDKVYGNITINRENIHTAFINANKTSLHDRMYNIEHDTCYDSFDFDSICCTQVNDKQDNIINNIMKQNYSVTSFQDIAKTIDPSNYNHLLSLIDTSYPDNDIDITLDRYDNVPYWGNPFYTQLPNAPNMKIICMYGVGLVAERAYYYIRDYNSSFKYPFRVNLDYSSKEFNVLNGIRLTEGDNSVPLLSLGFMCAKGWRNNPRLNPYNISTIIKEYKDGGESMITRGTVRGGSKSADHVDILGNDDLIKDIILIATGNTNNINEHIISNINQLSNEINL